MDTSEIPCRNNCMKIQPNSLQLDGAQLSCHDLEPSHNVAPCSDPIDSHMPLPAQQLSPTRQRFFLDLFVGHSAPLTLAAKAAGTDHFSPFDIEFNHLCDILDDHQFENLLQLAHSGLIGAIWSAPPCKFYSLLRQNDGGPPPLRSKEYLDGLPSLSP